MIRTRTFRPIRLKVLEKDADSYSAHLLMPSFMFEPAVKVIGDPSFQELDELANGFETSMLATAMRLADIDALPVILACFTRNWTTLE